MVTTTAFSSCYPKALRTKGLDCWGNQLCCGCKVNIRARSRDYSRSAHGKTIRRRHANATLSRLPSLRRRGPARFSRSPISLLETKHHCRVGILARFRWRKHRCRRCEHILPMSPLRQAESSLDPAAHAPAGADRPHARTTAEPEFSLTSRQAEVAGIEPIGRGFTSRGCSISTAIAAANGTGASQGANVCPAFQGSSRARRDQGSA